MPVEVQNFRVVNDGAVVAYCDTHLSNLKLTLRGWRIVRAKNGHLFASPPGTKAKDEDTWRNAFEFDKTNQDRLCADILEQAKKLMESVGPDDAPDEHSDLPF